MKRFLLIGDEEFDINVFKLKKYEKDIKCYTISNREVQLRFNDDIVKIEAVNRMINQYDDEERLMIPFKNPKILMFTYSSKEFAKFIINDDDLPDNLLIDDFAHISKRSEFLNEND